MLDKANKKYKLTITIFTFTNLKFSYFFSKNNMIREGNTLIARNKPVAYFS